MEKKNVGKVILNGSKEVLGYAIGGATAIVTTTVCLTFMPEAAPRAFEIAYKAGTYGLSGVMGSVAKTLTVEELNEFETNTRRFIKKHKKDKIEMEVVS